MTLNSPKCEKLDDLEFISSSINSIDLKEANERVISKKNFNESFTQIVLNRIIQNEYDNPYSNTKKNSTIDLRPYNKELFLNMFDFAMQNNSLILKEKLLYELCYLKQEQINFVSAFVNSLKSNKKLIHLSEHFTNDNLSEYLLESEFRCSKYFNLTVWNHLSRTQKFNFQNQTKILRAVEKNNYEFGTIYVSDSTADCIVFDDSINLFDAVLTLPGLKLRDLSGAYLEKIIELCHKVFIIEKCRTIKLIINVGFVDKLRITSSTNLIDQDNLEFELKKIIKDVIGNINNFNKNNKKIEIELQNNSFPTCTIENTKINGLVSYFSSNIEASEIIDKILFAEVYDNRVFQLFKSNSKIETYNLIHDREIHPKLGVKVKNL